MNRLFFIAGNNAKKQKGDMITFFLLTLVAAFLLFDAISAITGMSRVLDDRFDETRGAEMMLITGETDEERDCARLAITENTHVKDYEASPAFCPIFRFRNAENEEWKEYSFLIESTSTEKKYMVHELDGAGEGTNEIFLPLYLKGQFPIGDTMQIRVDDDIYDLRVAGYVEEPYFCSSMNITTYYSYLSQEMMDTMLAEHPVLEDARRIISKAVMNEDSVTAGYSTSDLEKEITDRYKELITPYGNAHPERNYFNYLSVSWEFMRGGSQFIPMIVSGIVMLFAVIIFTVAMIIICFSIRNYIQRSMKDTGVLEASGYTVKELRAALTMQTGLVSLLGTLAGIGLGIVTFGTFENVISTILGLTWNQPVNAVAAAMTAIVLPAFVILITRWVSRAYLKYTVLDALRGGISNHNYRKNHFSFEKTALPVPVVLSMKEMTGSKGRNIALALIVAILTISTLMGFGCYENFGKSADKLIELMGFEAGTIAVTGRRELGDELRKLKGAENVLGVYKFEPTYSFGDKEKTVTTYAVDDMENTLHTILIDGRTVKHDNEVMLTSSIARDLGVKIGDVVTVSFGDASADYLVTGLNQRMEQMGRSGCMIFEAAERILPNLSVVDYYVTGAADVTFADLKKEIDRLGTERGETYATADLGEELESTIGTMSTAMRALCIGIAILTVLVVIFVEALIIRAKIVREWRGMGISKALGMTAGGLITQIMLSSIPAVTAGVLIGALFSQPAGSSLCITAFSIFGLEKVPFHVPVFYMIATGLAILAVALVTAGIFGLKVRKINPVEMITEE